MLATRPRVLKREIDGESVILAVDREEYFGLDAMANEMFGVLETSGTIDEAVATLLESYDTDAATMTRDLKEFINSLEDLGLAVWREDVVQPSVPLAVG